MSSGTYPRKAVCDEALGTCGRSGSQSATVGALHDSSFSLSDWESSPRKSSVAAFQLLPPVVPLQTDSGAHERAVELLLFERSAGRCFPKKSGFFLTPGQDHKRFYYRYLWGIFVFATSERWHFFSAEHPGVVKKSDSMNFRAAFKNFVAAISAPVATPNASTTPAIAETSCHCYSPSRLLFYSRRQFIVRLTRWMWE